MTGIIAMIVAGGAGLLLLGWVLSGAPTERAIKKAAKRRVADVREGEEARIVGTVEIEAPIAAPLSGRECAFWTVLIEAGERVAVVGCGRWEPDPRPAAPATATAARRAS